MSEDDSPTWRNWLGLYADAFGVVGGVVLMGSIVSILAGWLFWPWLLIPLTVASTLVTVFILGRVFISNNTPIKTLGSIRHEREPIAPASVETPAKALSTPVQATPKPQPNIVILGEPYTTRITDVDESVPRQGAEEWAIVVDFRNEFKPDEEIKGLDNVLSQLTFSVEGLRVYRPRGYGLWLDQESPEATFERGATRRLYIASVQYLHLPELRHWVTTIDRYYTPPATVLVGSGEPIIVSIALFTQTRNRFYKTFDVRIVPELQVIQPLS